MKDSKLMFTAIGLGRAFAIMDLSGIHRIELEEGLASTLMVIREANTRECVRNLLDARWRESYEETLIQLRSSYLGPVGESANLIGTIIDSHVRNLGEPSRSS